MTARHGSTADRPGALVPLDHAVTAAAVACPVAGRPALARVLDALVGPGRVPADRVVVATAAELVDEVTSIVGGAGLREVSVIGCDAPATRARCVARGLQWLAAEPNSPVLVHDHHSPLTSTAVTDRVLAGLAGGHDVVVPTLPVTDTVKETDAGGAVVRTVDRQALRTVQYPRGYRATVLASLLDGGDEFTAALAAAMPVETVTGDADAVPAALPYDAALLEAIVAARPG